MTFTHNTTRGEWFESHRDYVPATTNDGGQPIPMYGLRMCVTLGDEGLPCYVWQWDNAENINKFEMAGLMTAVRDEMLHAHVLDDLEELKRGR